MFGKKSACLLLIFSLCLISTIRPTEPESLNLMIINLGKAKHANKPTKKTCSGKGCAQGPAVPAPAPVRK
ncbi:Uncharacterised protein g3195 [Pycnogonum litorale]